MSKKYHDSHRPRKRSFDVTPEGARRIMEAVEKILGKPGRTPDVIYREENLAIIQKIGAKDYQEDIGLPLDYKALDDDAIQKIFENTHLGIKDDSARSGIPIEQTGAGAIMVQVSPERKITTANLGDCLALVVIYNKAAGVMEKVIPLNALDHADQPHEKERLKDLGYSHKGSRLKISDEKSLGISAGYGVTDCDPFIRRRPKISHFDASDTAIKLDADQEPYLFVLSDGLHQGRPQSDLEYMFQDVARWQNINTHATILDPISAFNSLSNCADFILESEREKFIEDLDEKYQDFARKIFNPEIEITDEEVKAVFGDDHGSELALMMKLKAFLPDNRTMIMSRLTDEGGIYVMLDGNGPKATEFVSRAGTILSRAIEAHPA